MRLPAGGVPVVPDADEARRWARDELAGQVYAESRPGLFSRAVSWLLDRLSSLEVPVGTGSRVTIVLLLLLLALAVVVAVRLAGPARLARRQALPDVLGSSARSSIEHRSRADDHARHGEWAAAVRERFRAVVRSLEERALLTDVPGMTADEVARAAARLLPTVAGDLTAGARLFDDVQYGGRPATAEHDQQLRALDSAVATARPDLSAAAAP